MPYWIMDHSLLDKIRFLFSSLYQNWRIISSHEREWSDPRLLFALHISLLFLPLWAPQISKQDTQQEGQNVALERKCKAWTSLKQDGQWYPQVSWYSPPVPEWTQLQQVERVTFESNLYLHLYFWVKLVIAGCLPHSCSHSCWNMDMWGFST